MSAARSRNRQMRNLMVAALPVASLIGSIGFAGAAGADGTGTAGDSVEKTVAVVQPATVRLRMKWHAYVNTGPEDFGKVGPFDFSTSCTGFAVDSTGYIVTAGHCLDSSLEGVGADVLRSLLGEMVDAGYLTTAEANSERVIDHVVQNWSIEGEAAKSSADLEVLVGQGIALSGEGDVKGARARVIEVNPVSKGDVALVKVEATNMPTVQLADESSVSVGTNVLSVGYPGTSDDVADATMTATFKDGKISSKKTREGGLLPVYEISAAMSPGMSGGPTVTTDGKVLGLNSFYPTRENQQFNFLSPVSLIRETLTRNGVKAAPGPIDTLYKEAVDAFYGGKYRTASEKLDQVLQRVPSHQQAQELRSKAAEKQASDPEPAAASATGEGTSATPIASTANESSSSNGLLIGLGGVVLVVFIGGLVLAVVMPKRRNGSPAAGAYQQAPNAPVGPAAYIAPQAPQAPPAHPAPVVNHAAPAGYPAPTAPPAAPAMATAPMGTATMGTAPMGTAPMGTATMTLPSSNGNGPSFCPTCGTTSVGGDRFCRSCGHDLHA